MIQRLFRTKSPTSMIPFLAGSPIQYEFNTMRHALSWPINNGWQDTAKVGWNNMKQQKTVYAKLMPLRLRLAQPMVGYCWWYLDVCLPVFRDIRNPVGRTAIADWVTCRNHWRTVNNDYWHSPSASIMINYHQPTKLPNNTWITTNTMIHHHCSPSKTASNHD